MNQTSKHFPHGVDEYDATKLTKQMGTTVAVPFVAEAPVSLECKLWKIIDLPAPGNSKWVIGQVTGVHIQDQFIKDGLVDVTAYQPVARLGYKDYATVSQVYPMDRPK